MIRNACGCTTQGPGTECTDGGKLYAAVSQALQNLFNGKTITDDEQWIIYSLSRLAYIDHLNSWREGDVKIQRRAGFVMVFTRFSGQWIFQFGTKDEALLIDWLRNRGYQQYVQMKNERPRDRLLGYYRAYGNGKNGQRTSKGEMSPVQVQAIAEVSPLLQRGMTMPLERGVVSRTQHSFPIDLKTQVAIRVAFLVAKFTRSPTLSDRLSVQQHAAHLLQEHGIVIGPRDERTLQGIIDEAVWQKEYLKTFLEQSTHPPQA